MSDPAQLARDGQAHALQLHDQEQDQCRARCAHRHARRHGRAMVERNARREVVRGERDSYAHQDRDAEPRRELH